MHQFRGTKSVVFIIFLCLLSLQAASATGEGGASGDIPESGLIDTDTRPAIASTFLNMPLFFVPNEGQLDPGILYICKGQDYILTFARDRIGYSTPYDDAGAKGRYVVIQRFSGGNPDAAVEGLHPLETRVSYFYGDESEWHTDITPYGSIVYRELYPGIDVLYRGDKGSIKREFIVSPGADPCGIRMTYEGASQVRMSGDGGLVIKTGSGEIRETPPACYQETDGIRREIPCRFDVREDGSVSFYVGSYDPSLPLWIDPAIKYCGYIGGSGEDIGNDIAVDPAGNAYIAGDTESPYSTFPDVVGPVTEYYAGEQDAFVAKVNGAGTSLVYCGYLGDLGSDSAQGIAVDSAGNAYITGLSQKTQSAYHFFPVTVGPNLVHSGGIDAFVAKVNPSGTGLVYCGYIGGSGDEAGSDIAVDPAGNAYITGVTNSSESSFPETVGPHTTYQGGAYDAFVAKVNSGGTGLLYCGYLGGSDFETGNGITVDRQGYAYITGKTYSTDFPATAGMDAWYNGNGDAFVTKVNATGDLLIFSGYFGGSEEDEGNGIAIEPFFGDFFIIPDVYITGETKSLWPTFPVTGGSLDITQNGGDDAFVAKTNAWGSVTYCGYIGGGYNEQGNGIAVDTAGNAYITGTTGSDEVWNKFPVRGGPDLTDNGGYNAFVAKVNPAGNTLVYCGYLGGSGDDEGNGIAIDTIGNAYITGTTSSTEASFPITAGSLDTSYNGAGDAFVAKVNPAHLGVFRASTGDNWILTNDLATIAYRDHYGLATDRPLIGDFNNDGILDRAVFRNGNWILDYFADGTVNSNSLFGLASDIPLVLDFNGDGTMDRGVFRSGQWIIDQDWDGDVDSRTNFGMAGDVPLVGDIDNNGYLDRVVYRSGTWIVDLGFDGSVDFRISYGLATDIPLIGDFNGDRVDDRAVYRNGEWIIDYNFDGTVNWRPRFGMNGDVPMVWNV